MVIGSCRAAILLTWLFRVVHAGAISLPVAPEMSPKAQASYSCLRPPSGLLPRSVLRGGSEVQWEQEWEEAGLRDANGISSQRFGGIWGGPVLWKEGHYDPASDKATGWELGAQCHGDCVSWCDRKDEATTRAAIEADGVDCADNTSDSDDDRALQQPASSSRFPLAGEFGKLFEAFEMAADEYPESIQSSFAILAANQSEPLHSRIVYASPRFLATMAGAGEDSAPAPEDILGRSWCEFYGHVDAEKKQHFHAVATTVGEACESRFVLRERWWQPASVVADGSLGSDDAACAPLTTDDASATTAIRMMQQELLAMKKRLASAELLLGLQANNSTRTAVMYAEPILYGTGLSDLPRFIAVGVCDVTGWPVGEDGKTTYAEPDTIINGVEDYGYTGVTATHHSALEHLQVAVRCVKALFSTALIETFPQYQAYSTEWNKRRQFDEAYEAVKGPNRLHEWWAKAVARQDDIWNEDVDALCEDLGDWYRDYHEEALKGVAQVEERYKREAQRGLADSCVPPPGHPGEALYIEQQQQGKVTAAAVATPSSQEATGLEGCDRYFTGLDAEGGKDNEEARMANAKKLFQDLLQQHAQGSDSGNGVWRGREAGEDGVDIVEDVDRLKGGFGGWPVLPVGVEWRPDGAREARATRGLRLASSARAARSQISFKCPLSRPSAPQRAGHRHCRVLMSGEVGGHEGRSDGLHRLKHAIIDKYVERFPAYDRDKDEQLLAQRAEEAVARARVRFVEGLGDTRALEARVDSFFSDDATAEAAVKYVWEYEMQRLVGIEREKDRQAKLVVVLANVFVFTPIALGFMSNVPLREFQEVFAYTSHLLQTLGQPEMANF